MQEILSQVGALGMYPFKLRIDWELLSRAARMPRGATVSPSAAGRSPVAARAQSAPLVDVGGRGGAVGGGARAGAQAMSPFKANNPQPDLL